MGKNPLVSIIIPNYNRRELLLKTIQSALIQTYSNIEIIIVDDFSSDGSREFIEKYAENENKIRYFFLEQNSGANKCRNVGVSMAKGEYIAFLDSDDVWLSQKLEKQVEILENDENIGFVVCGFGETNLKGVKEGPIELKDLIKENNIGGFSVLMLRKSIFDKVGGLDESLPSSQDWDIYLKLLEISKGYKIKENLLYYEEQPDSISKNIERVLIGNDIVGKRAFELNNKYKLFNEKELLSYQKYYRAMRYIKFGDIKNGRKLLLESIRIKPNLTSIIYFIGAIFGKTGISIIRKVKIWLTKKIRDEA